MSRRVCIEIVDEHLWVLHHSLSSHHQLPRLHLHHVKLVVTTARLIVLVCTVHPSTLLTKLARDLRMHEKTFVTVAAFRKELAFVLRVHILALSFCLVALGPVSASHLQFAFSLLVIVAFV